MSNIRRSIDNSMADIKTNFDAKDIIHKANRNEQRKRSPLNGVVAAVMLLMVISLFSVSTYAYQRIENAESEFYLRYLSPEKMAVADDAEERFGADIYFEALASGDIYEQYFAINRLVTFYNDESVKARAILEIKPFLASDEPKLNEAVKFALSVLEDDFGHPAIVHMKDGVKVFALFPDYSDYGSLAELWMISNGELELYMSYDAPQMYCTGIFPSPSGDKIAVTLCSNKSNYVEVIDVVQGIHSPELIDSARVSVSQQLGVDFWQRMDYENYSGFENLTWVDNDNIFFDAHLSYNGGETVAQARVKYTVSLKKMDVEMQKTDD